MKKNIFILFMVFVMGNISIAQQIVMTTPSPEVGCPGITHDVVIGVKNTYGTSLPAGYPYSISISIFSPTNTVTPFYSNTQNFSLAVANNDTLFITLPSIDFSGITPPAICSVAVDLGYSFPVIGTGVFTTSGSYLVSYPPNLTLTESPSNTLTVSSSFGNYLVRYYLNSNYTFMQGENSTGVFVPYNVGSYTAKAYDEITGCISQLPSNAISISTALSTEEANEFNFSIYPNPMTSILNVSTKRGDRLFYEIVDLNGVVQLSSSFVSNTLIDVSGLVSGQYILSLKENDTLVSAYKLIK